MSAFRATLRTSLALGLGILVAFVTIMLIEQISHHIFPLPADIDWQDSTASTQYMSQLPFMALLLVIVCLVWWHHSRDLDRKLDSETSSRQICVSDWLFDWDRCYRKYADASAPCLVYVVNCAGVTDSHFWLLVVT